MRKILILDDEAHVVSALSRLIRQHRHHDLQVLTFTDPVEALARVHDTALDVVVSDFRMPLMSGLEFLAQVKIIQPYAVRMILSASYEFDIIQKAVNDVEVFRYMAKPWDEQELLAHLQKAQEKAMQTEQERILADAMRVQQGLLSSHDVECRRLEEQEPGITVVDWGPNGEIIMPEDLLDQGPFSQNGGQR